MGDLSKPIMTPLGVVYRSLCDTEREAMKYAEWAVKLFGFGEVNPLHIVGPGRKGLYEAAILATIPPDAKCMKERKGETTEWYGTPEHAYVLFDSVETPMILYFDKRELLFRPKSTPPMIAYHTMELNQ